MRWFQQERFYQEKPSQAYKKVLKHSIDVSTYIPGVNAEFKCLKTDGAQCPQTAGENGKLFGLAIFIKSILH